ncbi:MAG: tol-pal system-associated acyl-CoA thioesterase [Steroidobacteraceae bacterium]
MSGSVTQIRVYWEDTDGGGIVYYANYLRFFERARSEWLRALGFRQSELQHDPGVVFTVVRVEVDYHRPARLDDLLVVSCTPSAAGKVSLEFQQEIRRSDAGGELLASALVRVACLNARTMRPARFPAAIAKELA